MEKINVIEEKIKKDKNGDDFANVKLSDGRYLNFMFENFSSYEGLGLYEAELSKNGKFWNVTPNSLKFISQGFMSDDKQVKHQKSSEPTKQTPKSSLNHFDYDRGKLVNTCIMSASQIYQGKPEAAALGNPSVVIQVASQLLEWAEKRLKTTDKLAEEMEENVPF